MLWRSQIAPKPPLIGLASQIDLPMNEIALQTNETISPIGETPSLICGTAEPTGAKAMRTSVRLAHTTSCGYFAVKLPKWLSG